MAKNLMFQQIDDFNAPKWGDPTRPQQAHLDIVVDDLGAQDSEHALSLGATLLGSGGERFRGYVDPAGHPFDLSL